MEEKDGQFKEVGRKCRSRETLYRVSELVSVKKWATVDAEWVSRQVLQQDQEEMLRLTGLLVHSRTIQYLVGINNTDNPRGSRHSRPRRFWSLFLSPWAIWQKVNSQVVIVWSPRMHHFIFVSQKNPSARYLSTKMKMSHPEWLCMPKWCPGVMRMRRGESLTHTPTHTHTRPLKSRSGARVSLTWGRPTCAARTTPVTLTQPRSCGYPGCQGDSEASVHSYAQVRDLDKKIWSKGWPS